MAPSHPGASGEGLWATGTPKAGNWPSWGCPDGDAGMGGQCCSSLALRLEEEKKKKGKAMLAGVAWWSSLHCPPAIWVPPRTWVTLRFKQLLMVCKCWEGQVCSPSPSPAPEAFLGAAPGLCCFIPPPSPASPGTSASPAAGLAPASSHSLSCCSQDLLVHGCLHAPELSISRNAARPLKTQP